MNFKPIPKYPARQMKTLCVVFLMLLVAAGVSAQATPFGSVGVNFGGQTVITDGETDTSWVAAAIHTDTAIGLMYADDNVSVMAVVDGAGGQPNWQAVGTWKKDSFALSGGYYFLPCTFWSGLSFNQNSNYGAGATVIDRVPFIKAEFAGFQAGIGGNINGLDSFTPIFFAAYDYTAETFSAGVTFTGWASNLDGPDSKFPILATVRGLCNVGQLSISGNVGVYLGAPTLGKAAAEAVPVTFVPFESVSVAPEDSVILEGYVGAGYKVNDAVSAVLTVGYVHELAAEKDGGGDNLLQAGLAVPIGMGGGFTLIPGIIYQNKLSMNVSGSVKESKMSVLQYGVTLKYSF